MNIYSQSPPLRVVVSLSTIPNRIKLIQPVLRSIKNQSFAPDIIYLNIPTMSRKGGEYCIPDFVYNHCTVLRPEIDYGPITKLIPTLYQETDPETIIITFDDDRIIHPDVISILIKKQKEHPHAVLSFSGFCIGNFPFYVQQGAITHQDMEVDWVQGVHGILYKRKFVDVNEILEFVKEYPAFLINNDDHWISGYLAKKKINKISIGENALKYFTNLEYDRIDSLCKFDFKFFEQIFEICYRFKLKDLYYHADNIWESFGFWIVVFIITLFLLLFIFSPLLK